MAAPIPRDDPVTSASLFSSGFDRGPSVHPFCCRTANSRPESTPFPQLVARLSRASVAIREHQSAESGRNYAFGSWLRLQSSPSVSSTARLLRDVFAKCRCRTRCPASNSVSEKPGTIAQKRLGHGSQFPAKAPWNPAIALRLNVAYHAASAPGAQSFTTASSHFTKARALVLVSLPEG